ncbi:MAG: hypothetical protein ACLP7A_05720 [Desulfobaccales bacterium]
MFQALDLTPLWLTLKVAGVATLATFAIGVSLAFLVARSKFAIPVILITHDPEDVAVLAKTIVVYEFGKVSNIMSPTGEDFPVRELPSSSPLAATLAPLFPESKPQNRFQPSLAGLCRCLFAKAAAKAAPAAAGR